MTSTKIDSRRDKLSFIDYNDLDYYFNNVKMVNDDFYIDYYNGNEMYYVVCVNNNKIKICYPGTDPNTQSKDIDFINFNKAKIKWVYKKF